MHEMRGFSSDQHMGSVMLCLEAAHRESLQRPGPVGVAKPMELRFIQAAAASQQRDTPTR